MGAGEAVVTIDGTLDDDLTVELEVSETGLLTLPPTVTIPAGETSATLSFHRDRQQRHGRKPDRLS